MIIQTLKPEPRIASQMKTFNYFFGASLIHSILKHTDNLSMTMQHTTVTASEGQDLARMTIEGLKNFVTPLLYIVNEVRGYVQAILGASNWGS
jgi:hypothetical protein